MLDWQKAVDEIVCRWWRECEYTGNRGAGRELHALCHGRGAKRETESGGWRELKKWRRARWIVYGGVELYGYQRELRCVGGENRVG